MKTHRQMQALSDQVQQLAADSVGQDEPTARADTRSWGGGGGGRLNALAGTLGRLPPPRFSPPSGNADSPPPSTGGPALPPALDNAEAREQLRGFIAAELQRERDDQREKVRLQRDQEMQKRMEDAVKALGLNDADGKRFMDAVSKGQEDRRALRDKIQAGQIPRSDIPKEMGALRDQTDKQLKDILGDEGMQKYQELQRQDRQAQFAGWQGRPGAGPPRGGPPGAPGGGPPPTTAQ
jgi:hypothetical protein